MKINPITIGLLIICAFLISGCSTPTGSLHDARAGHTATLLRDGRVLVVGGDNNSGPVHSAEIYSPITKMWTKTSPPGSTHAGHTATLLTDGSVLVLDEHPELYDPDSDLWNPVPLPATPRSLHTATLVADGKVLMAGGTTNAIVGVISRAELYDPKLKSWRQAGTMTIEREYHTATRLLNGKVLVIGGNSGASNSNPNERNMLTSAELYDHALDQWIPLPENAPSAHCFHTATRLLNGDVMIMGGWAGPAGPVKTMDVYQPLPIPGTWISPSSANPPSPLNRERYFHTMTLLKNGRVLTSGGNDGHGVTLASIEVYNGVQWYLLTGGNGMNQPF